MNEPKEVLLTIITVTYNAEKSLEKTIESVLAQKGYSAEMIMEWIFVDGMSQDHTFDILQNSIPRIEQRGIRTQIVREKDQGIYDAMNKGITRAHGRWVYMLNAGDVLYNEDVFADLEPRMYLSDAEIIYGDFCRRNTYITQNRRIPPLQELRQGMIFCHQAVFIRDTLYHRRKYNQAYKYGGDYDLLLNAYLQGVEFEYVPVCVVFYDIDGLTARQTARAYQDEYSIRKAQGIIRDTPQDKMRFGYGYAKRVVLTAIPQKLRWKLYKLIKEY